MTTCSFSLCPRLLLAVVLLACLGLPLAARPETVASQETEASGLNIKRTVRRVVVDVAVTDSEGKPVRDLNQDDFSVLEDGKQQKILSFDVHELEAPPAVGQRPALPPNTFANVSAAPERGPLYVLLLDLVHTEIIDQPFARQQLLKFISNKPLGTRFAVFVLSDGLHLVQGFTDDQEQLAAVVNPAKPGHHVPRIFLQGDNYRPYLSLLGTMLDLSRFLHGMPGRKNVIWMSGSFPTSILPTSDPATEAVNYSEEIKQATDAMARDQIAVYPVDVRGTVITSTPSTMGTNGTSSSVEDPVDEGAGSGSGGAGSANAPNSLLTGSYMTEEQIARATGGHAFFSTNDLKGALAEATERGANYYTLSYSPTNEKYDGKLRNIRVTLAKDGYHLAYRRTYFGEDPDVLERRLAAPLTGSLFTCLKHGAPIAHELSLTAHVHAVGPPAKATPQQMSILEEQAAFFQARRRKKNADPPRPIDLQTYDIEYTVGVRQPGTGMESGGGPSLTLQFATAVFDADGHVLNGKVQDAVGVSSPTPLDTSHRGTYRVQQQIEAPLDSASIRIAVRDVTTDRVGALEVPLPLEPEPDAEITISPSPAKPN